MKNVLISLLFSSCVFSQTNLLDQKNGFKTLKFGTPKSTFSNLQYMGESGGLARFFYYPTEIDLFKVFDLQFKYIILGFEEDKLTTIQLMKLYKDGAGHFGHKEALDDLGYLYTSFNTVLFKGETIDKEDDVGFIHKWLGEKVGLYIDLSLEPKSAKLDDEGNPIVIFSNTVTFMLLSEPDQSGF